ncbi:prolyl oligopeptidase family serine peptidase [Rhodanobacter sp. B05]|uniref:S9 family peptidase n=1 Tax=Rhodanobacter sp. B05 TaxID=1945859 RepID=UPI00143A5C88|nr:prolyl oligopeptidase family serine peptidase [Rhodanobacter sp. B05]
MACMFALLLAAAPGAASAQKFTLEQALGYPFPYGLTAATHGSRIAWVFNLHGSRNVWVADGPGFDARQLTHYTGDDGMPLASLRLTPDGATVIYARGSETNSQGEVADPTGNVKQPEQQVWAANVADGKPRLLGTMNCTFEGCEDIQVSPDGKQAVWSGQHKLWLAPVSGEEPARPLAYVRGKNSQPRWSPDGKQIAFVSNRGTHDLIGVYRLGDASVRYIAPDVFHDTLPRWSADGSRLAFIRILGSADYFLPGKTQPWAIWVWNAADGNTTQIWHSADNANGSYGGLDEWQANAFQFAAGNRIVFASQRDGWVHLYSIAADGGSPMLLTPGKFSFQGSVSLTGHDKALLYSSNESDLDRRHLWRVAVDHPGATELTHGASIEWSPVVTGDGAAVVFLGSTATRPAMPFRLTRRGQQMIAPGALPVDYPSAQMIVPRQVVFKSLDGLEIHGQLFVPRGTPMHSPALVFTHGGPPRQMVLGFHPMDAYNYMYAANQYLASRGFVVLSVNYRMGTMYGRAFRQPAHAGPLGASEYQDVVAGAKYLQSLPYVDAQKIGLWGGSYGGYLTAMGLARNSDIFKAGVDYAGVHDWTSLLGGAPGVTAQVKKVAYEASPVASIAKWKSPVLLIQADDDRNVPFAQTVDLVPLLRQHHIPCELIVMPDETHDLLRWHSWLRVFDATANFFERTLMKGETITTTPEER